MDDQETDYILRRASEEAVLALHAAHPAAASAHQGLAVHYSARAAALLAEEEEEQPVSPVRAQRG